MGMGSAEDRREQQISKYNHDQFRSMLGIENDGYGRDDIHSHIPPSQRLSKNLNSDRLRRNKSIDIYIKNDGRSLKDRENSADPDLYIYFFIYLLFIYSGENIAQLNQIKKIKHNGDLDSIAQQIKFISRRFKLAADGQPRINGNNDSSWMKDVIYRVLNLLLLLSFSLLKINLDFKLWCGWAISHS